MRRFTAEVYTLAKEEGGMVMPGDTVTLEVEFEAPAPLERGLRFAIREGGLTVGAGSVLERTGPGDTAPRTIAAYPVAIARGTVYATRQRGASA